MAHEPLELRRRKASVELEAGAGLDQWTVTRGCVLGAKRIVAAAPPDNGRVQRLAGGAVEADDGFALIGQAERDDLREAGGLPSEERGEDSEPVPPDLLGVELDPIGLRVVWPVLGRFAVERATNGRDESRNTCAPTKPIAANQPN